MWSGTEIRMLKVEFICPQWDKPVSCHFFWFGPLWKTAVAPVTHWTTVHLDRDQDHTKEVVYKKDFDHPSLLASFRVIRGVASCTGITIFVCVYVWLCVCCVRRGVCVFTKHPLAYSLFFVCQPRRPARSVQLAGELIQCYYKNSNTSIASRVNTASQQEVLLVSRWCCCDLMMELTWNCTEREREMVFMMNSSCGSVWRRELIT